MSTFNNSDHKVPVAVEKGANKAINIYNRLNKQGLAGAFDGFDIPNNTIGKQVAPILKSKGIPYRLVKPSKFKKNMIQSAK